MLTPEGKVKKEIKAFLDSIGAYSHWPVQMGYGARTVDCLSCVRGKFLAIEVKREKGGKLTVNQEITLRRVAEARGLWVVASSVQAVIEVVRSIP